MLFSPRSLTSPCGYFRDFIVLRVEESRLVVPNAQVDDVANTGDLRREMTRRVEQANRGDSVSEITARPFGPAFCVVDGWESDVLEPLFSGFLEGLPLPRAVFRAVVHGEFVFA